MDSAFIITKRGLTIDGKPPKLLAGSMGLEPTASGVTGDFMAIEHNNFNNLQDTCCAHIAAKPQPPRNQFPHFAEGRQYPMTQKDSTDNIARDEGALMGRSFFVIIFKNTS